MTVFSGKIWKDIRQPDLSPSERSLRGPDAKLIQSQGKFSGTLTLHDRKTTDVVSGLTKPLLGRPAIDQQKLIQRLANVNTTQTPREQFPSLFQGRESWNSHTLSSTKMVPSRLHSHTSLYFKLFNNCCMYAIR